MVPRGLVIQIFTQTMNLSIRATTYEAVEEFEVDIGVSEQLGFEFTIRISVRITYS